ncbi:peptide maturation system protein, TIGR04066 family [Clostridium cavendishii DSM 21758]|uniref:Peptide maturation system protein, TIGR04066 family n=1 Tax=Clostridium cavendishii DSM 21758 TaxID=1121302 RepID=A0A1M6R490_9CLOT|nr:TIGR04066 family peptide maturation system protein [Clostridium cavendishii]SHK27148.1 peptide maturation system protein, TIGR04066 family [Clostridium cavendishii DSM 21758]
MQKEKVMVYPFDLEFSPVIRHENFLDSFEIVELVSPKGWGLVGKDASFADGGDLLEMIVKDDFMKGLEKCDTVIFSDSEYYEDMENDIYLKMQQAAQSKKNIVSFLNLEGTEKKHILELSKTNNIYAKFVCNIEDTENNYLSGRQISEMSEVKYKNNSFNFEYIHKIETPIIFVMGLLERISKFEIQLSLRDKFQKMGYKVCQIGSRNYCELLGFHSFPHFMQVNYLSEVDKITMFNHYVKKIEDEERPDVIIIGIPGGTMKVNNEFTNKFGTYAYEISQAVEPDYFIMSTSYEKFKPEYFANLSLSAKYKFGHEIDCFNMANVQIDWNKTIELLYDIYIKLDSNFVSNKVEEYLNENIPVFNIFDAKHVDEIVNNIIDKLSSYAETEII